MTVSKSTEPKNAKNLSAGNFLYAKFFHQVAKDCKIGKNIQTKK